MVKYLLSIDWDYFINMQKGNWGSYIENKKTLIDLWYKRYIQSKENGKNLQKFYQLSLETDQFWQKIKKVFRFQNDAKFYVSDSHVLSYDIAKENNCNTVFNFDAHSDLGYGGISSLNFEVNCANWLGKLLKNKLIKKADIIYSPYTQEKPEYFNQMNNMFDIQYPSEDELGSGIKIAAIHICRSGAWTPPWYDERFLQFVNDSGFSYETIDCPPRKWDPRHISFSDQLYYLMA